MAYEDNPKGVFASRVRQPELLLAEADRTSRKGRRGGRYAMIPDGLYSWSGRPAQKMGDVKLVYPSRVYASRSAQKRGVVVGNRQVKVRKEYATAAKRADRLYNLTPAGQVGRVESHLANFGEVRGWVFGAFGEASSHVREFVEEAALAGSAGWRRLGCATQEAAKGMLKGMYGRWLAVQGVRSHARAKLEVLNHTMAWGAAAAAGLAQARSQGEQRRLDELARLELARWHGPRRFAGVCG